MAGKRRRSTSGDKRPDPKAYKAWCRKQTLAGFTTDASGQWVKANPGSVPVQHLRAGYKAH